MQSARERVAEVLAARRASSAPCVQLTASTSDLRLMVDGVGRVGFPIGEEQVRALIAQAEPASFGHRDRTVTDTEVRHTWQVPTDLVTDRWNDALPFALDDVRRHFGLPDSARLVAELHSLLVYEPGQFFRPHQDSEKHDQMIGTLVVTLPSAHTGGELVVHHGGESRTHRGTDTTLGLVAFHADRYHEVREVQSGYRVTVTYNLLVDGPAELEPSGAGEADLLAALLAEHFAERPARKYRPGEFDDPPDRLVYLLDHEYSERGLSWSRLKGVDRDRVARLLDAAEKAHCVTVLALSEVQETWDAEEPDSSRRRRGYRYGVPDPEPEESAYEVNDLIDSSVSLTHCIDRSGESRTISLAVAEAELCTSTASAELTPHTSQYEGYMGNWGNTLDRWYRRAAIVIWPLDKDFAVRAQAAPEPAMRELVTMVEAGQHDQARAAATTLTPFWDSVVATGGVRGLLLATLRAATALDDASLARTLLTRFRVENLHSDHAAALAALANAYGPDWTGLQLAAWFEKGTSGYEADSDRTTWLGVLPELGSALLGSGAGAIAAELTRPAWRALARDLAAASTVSRPSTRTRRLADHAPALLGLLRAAALAGQPALVDDAVAFCKAHGEALQDCLRPLLQLAGDLPMTTRVEAGCDTLAGHCMSLLREGLQRPGRAEGDWSVPTPGGCSCALCMHLREFLADPTAQSLEWPLAEAGRRHVHERIDSAELPVRHQTRRSGRPFTLVLTKDPGLQERDRAAREELVAQLRQLEQQWPLPGGSADA